MTDQRNSPIAYLWRCKLWFVSMTLGSLAIAATFVAPVPVHSVARGAVIMIEVGGPARAAGLADI